MTTALASATLLLAHTGVADICGSWKFGISFKPRNSLMKTTQPFFHRVGCSFVTPADALPQRRQLQFAASDKVAETEPSKLSEVENNDEEIEESDAEVSDNADVEQEPQSFIQMLQQSYKQAIAVNDERKIADIETQLQSIEDERNTLSQQAVCLREELATEKLHEAVMREESTEFEEGIIIDEFRRGFILGDRLLRPAMAKVSAGPGPTMPVEASTEMVDASEETAEAPEETTQDSDDASPSADASPAES